MAPSRMKSAGGGRGAGQKSRSGRNGNVKSNSASNDKTKQSLDDLTDMTFDVGDNRTADTFVNAKKRLVEYVGSTFDLGADIATSIETGTLHVVPMPVEPVTAVVTAAVPEVVADPANGIAGVPARPEVRAPLSNMQAMLLSGQVKSYLYQVNKLAENVKKAYAIVLKQCTLNLQSKLEERPEWAALKMSCDVLVLLELIRSLVFRYEERMYQPLSLHRVKQTFYSFRQGNLSNIDYLQAFKNRYDMANSHDVVLFDEEVAVMLMKQNPADAAKEFHSRAAGNLTEPERATYLQRAKDLCQAIAFLSQSDMKRYGELLSELQNDYTKGKMTYPDSLTKAHQYLNDYKVKPTAIAPTSTAENAVAFAQQSNKGGKEFPRWMKNKTCHNCGEEGHISTVCPNGAKDESEDEEASTSAESKSDSSKKEKADAAKKKAKKKASFAQRVEDEDDTSGDEEASLFTTVGILKKRGQGNLNLRKVLLIDNQSTLDLMCNEDFVTRIHEVDRYVRVHGNGGNIRTNLRSHLKGYGWTWFSRDAIANILSLKNVAERFEVTYDSARDGGRFIVHKPNRKLFFNMHPSGLY